MQRNQAPVGQRFAVAVAAALVCSGASAQSLRVEPSLAVNATQSTNILFATGTSAKQGDLQLTLSPNLRVVGSGGGYRLQGNLGLDVVTYVSGNAKNQVMPNGRLDGNVRLIDRLLFVDAGLSATTTPTDPFGVQPGAATSVNTTNITRERFSPYIEREISPGTTLRARSDNNWTQSNVNDNASTANLTPLGGSTTQANTASFDMLPQPLGVKLQADQTVSRFRDVASSRITFKTVRASALYAPDPQLYFGLTVGRDQGQYGSTNVSDTLRGVILHWRPTERTNFDGTVEKRFFGTGWNVTATHRTPYFALSSSASRTATTSATLLASLTNGGDTRSLLDAALTTRIPDPGARDRAVSELISQRGLQSTLPGAVNLYSDTAQQIQSVDVNLALLSPRHTMGLRLFRQETRNLPTSGNLPGISIEASQIGGTLTGTRRLSTQWSADVALTAARVLGLGDRTGDRGVNRSARVGATYLVSPRTTVSGGARRQLVKQDNGSPLSAAAAPSSTDETAFFVGAVHRF